LLHMLFLILPNQYEDYYRAIQNQNG